MYIHISAFTIILLLIVALIYNRHRLLPYLAPLLPTQMTARLSNYVPLQSFSFADQVRAGMSSSEFDVENTNLGDTEEGRVGLDEEGVEEVRRIMAINRCNFDQARLIRHNKILAKNGIAPDGTPLDSKAITRLS